MQSESKVFDRDWNQYYNAIIGRPPRDTLLLITQTMRFEELILPSDLDLISAGQIPRRSAA